MPKAIEAMSERELLMELVRHKRRQEQWLYIKLGCYALLLIAVTVLAIRYVPPVIRFFRDLNDSVQHVRDTLRQVRSAIDNAKLSGVDALRSATEQLNELLGRLGALFR